MPTDGTLYQPLADYYAHHLAQATEAGWTGREKQALSQLQHNTSRFAAFKAYAVQTHLHQLRADDDGVARSFADFRTVAQAVHERYQRYFQTELNQATGGAQMASKWGEFAPGALLRYDTAEDDRVRDDHAVYDGITRPKDDPFWDSHYPPCDWGCRCTVTEVDDDAAVTPAHELNVLPDVPEEFRQNVGKTGEIFGPEHPYFDVPKKVAAKIEEQIAAQPRPATQAFTVNRLRKLGIRVSPGSDATLTDLLQQHLPTANLPHLAQELQELADAYRVQWTSVSMTVTNPAVADGDVLSFRYVGQWQGQAVKMEWALSKQGAALEANHTLLTLPADLQGQDFSRALHRALYTEYKRIGVAAIHLEAGLEAGGYVWAKAGFSAEQQVDVLAILREARTKKIVPAPVLDIYERLVQQHYQRTPTASFSMLPFAQAPYGKSLLMARTWKGVLDLTNPAQIRIFEQYLQAKK